MSTSPRRAFAVPTSEGTAGVPLSPFPYDVVAEIYASDGTQGSFGVGDGPDRDPIRETHRREAQLSAEARRQGQAEAQTIFEDKLARERSGIATALAQFTRDRASYFEKVEGEVVQLALNIARKILHREAQVDPLLLAGIVRVALEKIDQDTGVILRVHPQQSMDWRQFLTTQLEPADLPEIVENASLAPNTCVLETAMGTATFGLEVQMKEIEQGLMDLLAARPGAKS